MESFSDEMLHSVFHRMKSAMMLPSLFYRVSLLLNFVSLSRGTVHRIWTFISPNSSIKIVKFVAFFLFTVVYLMTCVFWLYAVEKVTNDRNFEISISILIQSIFYFSSFYRTNTILCWSRCVCGVLFLALHRCTCFFTFMNINGHLKREKYFSLVQLVWKLSNELNFTQN